MPNLYLMCGIPGSGKTTWCHNHLTDNDTYVSRDEIRFSIVREDEEYFSHETEVFDTFVNRINEGLKSGKNVYADATHLNKASRNKLLNNLNNDLYNHVYVVYLKEHLSTALERNEERKNSRSYVPRSQLRRMAYSLEEPTVDERFDTIYVIENDKLSSIINRG